MVLVMRCLKPVSLIILLFLLYGSVWASCATISAEDADLYARQDLLNRLPKLIICAAIFLLSLFGAIRLLKQERGWIIVVILSLIAIPIILGFMIMEVLWMECPGSGGIPAAYYLIPLAISALAFALTRWGFAGTKPVRLGL